MKERQRPSWRRMIVFLFSIEMVGKADFLLITHLNMGQTQNTGKSTQHCTDWTGNWNYFIQHFEYLQQPVSNTMTQIDVTKGRMMEISFRFSTFYLLLSYQLAQWMVSQNFPVSFCYRFQDLQNLLRFAKLIDKGRLRTLRLTSSLSSSLMRMTPAPRSWLCLCPRSWSTGHSCQSWWGLYHLRYHECLPAGHSHHQSPPALLSWLVSLSVCPLPSLWNWELSSKLTVYSLHWSDDILTF